jgi:uncharacterized protein
MGGSVNSKRRTPPAVLGPLILVCAFASSASARETLTGHWEGSLVREGAELMVSFDFTQGQNGLEGTFSAATQRALGIPLDTVSAAGARVHFVLDGSLVFDGEVADGSLRGAFREGEAKGTFTLIRAPVNPPPYRSEEVSFRNGSVVLAGTLYLPPGPGPHAGILFNHGSGPEGRFASRFWADSMARHGIAALIYDKRGVGASTGDWTQSSFEDLADDAIAGVHLLQRQPNVNAKQVGIYGHSQGGTIAPLIATRSRDVAFIIAAAAIGMPVYQQDLFRTRNGLRAAGFSEDAIQQAMTFYSAWVDAARGNLGPDQLKARTAGAQSQKWFEYVAPPPDDSWLWKWYPRVGNYNGVPLWERVTVPVLLVYGERDENTPVHDSIRSIEKALKKAGNRHYTILILPRAAHNLTVRSEPGEPFEWWGIAPGFSDLLVDWVLGVSRGD